jgi:hypothetical protein
MKLIIVAILCADGNRANSDQTHELPGGRAIRQQHRFRGLRESVYARDDGVYDHRAARRRNLGDIIRRWADVVCVAVPGRNIPPAKGTVLVEKAASC